MMIPVIRNEPMIAAMTGTRIFILKDTFIIFPLIDNTLKKNTEICIQLFAMVKLYLRNKNAIEYSDTG